MNKRAIRAKLNLLKAILFCWLYFPHLILYRFRGSIRCVVDTDLDRRADKLEIKISKGIMFLYYIHNDRFFRTLFYHRIGPVMAMLIGWWRPGDRYFVISKTTKIGEGAYFAPGKFFPPCQCGVAPLPPLY